MSVAEELFDKPRPVRTGDELDTARLLTYLQTELPELTGTTIVVEQFPAGYSNLTYLVRIGAREFVLRRPPFGAKIKTAHDMSREYFILSRLRPCYAKVPRPILFCADESVLGAPFYLMERVQGVILRAQRPNGLAMSSQLMRRLSESFIQNLVEIHAIDYEAAGLGELGRADGYILRQIAGWTKRYYAARTDDLPEVERLVSWLAEHTPADSGRTLIHNDYKYDNVVLAPDEPSRVLAVLDWEMATIGDPLMDFGTTLGYWVDPDDPEEWQRLGFSLTALPGSLRRSDVVAHYATQTGRDVGDVVFYYAYGLLKIAVIAQQIYFRYRQGFTTDPRFADLLHLIRACGLMAARAIEQRRIERLG